MLMDSVRFLNSATELKKQDGSTKWLGGALYDLSGYTISKPIANSIMMQFSVDRDFVLPAGMPGSYSESLIAPAADITYFIKNNGTAVGTLYFAINSNVGIFGLPVDTTFVIGDILTIESPSVADDTHDEISWNIRTNLVL